MQMSCTAVSFHGSRQVGPPSLAPSAVNGLEGLEGLRIPAKNAPCLFTSNLSQNMLTKLGRCDSWVIFSVADSGYVKNIKI